MRKLKADICSDCEGELSMSIHLHVPIYMCVAVQVGTYVICNGESGCSIRAAKVSN